MEKQRDRCTPRTVIRGESYYSHNNKQLAFIDWLGFTVRGLTLQEVRTALEDIFSLKDILWTYTDKGWCGYTYKIELGPYGTLAHGGQSQNNTINVQLRPQACRQLKNLTRIIKWAEKNNAVITRCDVAHDDFEGDTVNINQAKIWDKEDGFTTNGRKPKLREIINHDKTVGNTLYVGKRQNGKMLRIYEKGKEQGDPKSTWNRVEVEFRNKDRVIPWDILIDPGIYLSGAYPCLSFLSKNQSSIKTAKKAHEIAYDAMVCQTRLASGNAINAMLMREKGDISKVILDLQRDSIPKRLEPYSDLIKDKLRDNV